MCSCPLKWSNIISEFKLWSIHGNPLMMIENYEFFLVGQVFNTEQLLTKSLAAVTFLSCTSDRSNRSAGPEIEALMHSRREQYLLANEKQARREVTNHRAEKNTATNRNKSIFLPIIFLRSICSHRFNACAFLRASCLKPSQGSWFLISDPRGSLSCLVPVILTP